MNVNVMKLVKEHLDERIERDRKLEHIGCIAVDTWPAVFLSSLLGELLQKAQTEGDTCHGA